VDDYVQYVGRDWEVLHVMCVDDYVQCVGREWEVSM